MILGLGSDIVDIRRIEAMLAKQGARFENKIFTAKEREKAKNRKVTKAETYAKRFAAKEACIKALATRDIAWHDMEITNLKSGAPKITLRGGALKRLKKMTPRRKKATLLLTLADEYPYALAMVMITAAPASPI